MDWNIIQNSLSNFVSIFVSIFVLAILLITAISYWFNLSKFNKNPTLSSIGKLSTVLLLLEFFRKF